MEAGLIKTIFVSWKRDSRMEITAWMEAGMVKEFVC